MQIFTEEAIQSAGRRTERYPAIAEKKQKADQKLLWMLIQLIGSC
jgi:hypothetical protein